MEDEEGRDSRDDDVVVVVVKERVVAVVVVRLELERCCWRESALLRGTARKAEEGIAATSTGWGGVTVVVVVMITG